METVSIGPEAAPSEVVEEGKGGSPPGGVNVRAQFWKFEEMPRNSAANSSGSNRVICINPKVVNNSWV